MADIKHELDRIKGRISDANFLANKGLSNEVGIHVSKKKAVSVQLHLPSLGKKKISPQPFY